MFALILGNRYIQKFFVLLYNSISIQDIEHVGGFLVFLGQGNC